MARVRTNLGRNGETPLDRIDFWVFVVVGKDTEGITHGNIVLLCAGQIADNGGLDDLVVGRIADRDSLATGLREVVGSIELRLGNGNGILRLGVEAAVVDDLGPPGGLASHGLVSLAG